MIWETEVLCWMKWNLLFVMVSNPRTSPHVHRFWSHRIKRPTAARSRQKATGINNGSTDYKPRAKPQFSVCWLDLSSLHNSIQSRSCWQGLRKEPALHPACQLIHPPRFLQLLWMEKRWRTERDRPVRKWSANEEAKDLMAVYSTRPLPHVHGWTCVSDIRAADDEKNKRCTFTVGIVPSLLVNLMSNACFPFTVRLRSLGPTSMWARLSSQLGFPFFFFY